MGGENVLTATPLLPKALEADGTDLSEKGMPLPEAFL